MAVPKQVAGVCLLDNPFPIDGVYDYRIPEELLEEVHPGVFVTVPFGTANHRRLALVREVRGESAYAELKAIVSVCPEQISLDEEMLGLCFYMKEQTLCSFGDAVHALIPSAAMSRLRDVYRLTDTPISPALQSNETAVAVHRELTERGAVTEEALCRKFGKDITAILKKMEHAGLILRETQLQAATNEKKEYRYAFALPTEDIEALIAGEIPPSLKGTLRTSFLLGKGETCCRLSSSHPLGQGFGSTMSH